MSFGWKSLIYSSIRCSISLGMRVGSWPTCGAPMSRLWFCCVACVTSDNGDICERLLEIGDLCICGCWGWTCIYKSWKFAEICSHFLPFEVAVEFEYQIVRNSFVCLHVDYHRSQLEVQPECSSSSSHIRMDTNISYIWLEKNENWEH